MYKVMRTILAMVCLLVTLPRAAHATSSDLSIEIRASISAALDELEKTGDYLKAHKSLQTQFDRVVIYASFDDADLLRESALALRLVWQLADLAQESECGDLLRFLLDNEELASVIAFLVKPKKELPGPIYALLDELRLSRASKITEYVNLASAICVVHEKPFSQRVNENFARSASAIDIFDYFASNEKNLLFGLRNVPAELLIYVVDTTATIEEMTWALNRYRGDEVVGARFFDIKYDYDHYYKGTPKKVTVAGWNLPNILEYGGVCADQAYYAMTVGKAIGVPTAYAVGRGSKSAHAWVGFLQARGRDVWWNFDIGRYSEYQGVRGNILDPQIRRGIPDSFVSLLASLANISAKDRHTAAAYIDAAIRLREIMTRKDLFQLSDDEAVKQRPLTIEAILDLTETGLRISPGYAPGWIVVRDLASDGLLTLKQKKYWSTVLHRLCGSDFPDFYLEILQPMIESIDDMKEQNALWNKAFKLFSKRTDLAAEVRMAQGRQWAKAGNIDRAGQCYEDVIFRFSNSGHYIVYALKSAEKILRDAGEGQKLLRLFDRAFSSIRRPKDVAGPFFRQSNYYRVGKMYMKILEEAGLYQQADELSNTIGR